MSAFQFTDDPVPPAGERMLHLQVPPALADKQAVLAWYARRLHFPSYFRANWDAFSDCILDLSWLAASTVVIAHDDLPMMGYPSDQDIYLDILTGATRAWGDGTARVLKITFPTRMMRAVDNRMIVVGRYMSTRELILRSFPDGVAEEDYRALIWAFDDAQMSQRSIATALAESGVKNYTAALHDTLGVLAERHAYEAHGRKIIEKMKPYGYDSWRAQLDKPLSQLHVLRALEQMEAVLREGEQTRGARLIARILTLNYGSEEFWSAATGLEIWGGSGSLFDQAFMSDAQSPNPLRLHFHRIMLELSNLIVKEGRSTHLVRSANAVLRQWAKE